LILLLLGACQALEIEARVDATLATIEGTASCVGDARYLLSYPAALADARGLNDVNRHWFYPQRFAAAAMHPYAKVWNEGRFDGRFVTTVPPRQGTFGRVGATLVALGGWHPIFTDGARPDPLPIRYRVEVPPGYVGLIGGRPIHRSPGAQSLSGEFRGVYLPLLLTRQQGVQVATWGVWIDPDPQGDARPHFAAVDAALQQSRAAHAGPPIAVVVLPLRENLAEPFDGGFAVSDAVFDLLPVERMRKFHRIRLWRAHLQAMLQARAGPAVAEAIAWVLRDALVREHYGGAETAADVLDTFAVIPEIDSLVFAPQIPFADAYFDHAGATAGRYWHIDDFYVPDAPAPLPPGGKRLRARLTDDAVHAFLQGGAPLAEGPQSQAAAPPQPGGVRVLLQNITGLLAVTDGQLSLSADISARRLHDPRYSADLLAFRTPRQAGVLLGADRHFGDALTPLRLRHALGLQLGFARLDDDRDQVTLALRYGTDSRLNALRSFAGHGVRAHVSVARAGPSVHGGASLAALYLHNLGGDRALVVRARVNALWGDASAAQELRLGDRYLAGRGFSEGAAHGKLRGVLSGEHRHALHAGPRGPLGGWLTVWGVDGALFADAVYLPSQGCDWHGDVGYGLRFFADVLAVSPTTLQLDLGFPASRCHRGEMPFAFYVALQQSFAAF
jgi:hypothetical protein